MVERRRFLPLIVIMAVVTLVAVGIGIKLLYDAAFEEARERLIDTAQSQARLIEAVARFDSIYSQEYPGGARPATLSQVIDAHEQHTGFGETGELDLVRREGDQIVFLLSHRFGDGTDPSSVPFDSDLAEPMRLALQGESGSIVGLDEHGNLVLAAYEPVAELDLGITAKIDLAEVNAPFVRTGWIVAATALVAVVVGAWLFRRITAPVERQMKRYSEQLEGMVEERTSELHEAQAELVRSERLAILGQFSGNISHELRNPLGVIDSSVYYLKRKLGGDDKKVSEHLDRIKLSVANSTMIIESLLSLTRMKEPSLADTDLVAVVDGSIATSQVPARISVERVIPEAEVTVHGDQEQLRMAFKNIVKNAVEAMSGSGTLTVSIKGGSNGTAEVSFADTGEGIDSENLEAVFQPLFSTKAKGIGFGLSIARMVVDRHGGTLSVASEPGRGTVFTARLPLAAPQAREGE